MITEFRKQNLVDYFDFYLEQMAFLHERYPDLKEHYIHRVLLSESIAWLIKEVKELGVIDD